MLSQSVERKKITLNFKGQLAFNFEPHIDQTSLIFDEQGLTHLS